jgi:hypothetical protein
MYSGISELSEVRSSITRAMRCGAASFGRQAKLAVNIEARKYIEEY